MKFTLFKNNLPTLIRDHKFLLLLASVWYFIFKNMILYIYIHDWKIVGHARVIFRKSAEYLECEISHCLTWEVDGRNRMSDAKYNTKSSRIDRLIYFLT